MNAGTLVRVSFPSVESRHHPMRDTHQIGCTPGLRTFTGVALGTGHTKCTPFTPRITPLGGLYDRGWIGHDQCGAWSVGGVPGRLE
jgi:hypothetical protein